MKPQPLTVRQRQIYDFLKSEIQTRGVAPSLDEIGRRFGLSSLATTSKHLNNLVERGWIARRWNSARAITILAIEGVCPHCGQQMATVDSDPPPPEGAPGEA